MIPKAATYRSMAMNQTILEWQHGRRIQGLPTLSTLVGPVALGVREWGGWNATVPRSVLTGFNLTEIARTWFAQVADSHRLTEWAWDGFHRALANTGIKVQIAPGRTRYDLNQLWNQLPDRVSDASLLMYRVLAVASGPVPLSFETLEQELGVVPLLAGLCGVVPIDEWPAILLIGRGLPDDFHEAIRILKRIAVRIPLLPIAVSVSAEVWKAAAADTREIALAREGLIELSGVTATELQAKLLVAGVAEPLPHEAIARLAAEGLDSGLAEVLWQRSRNLAARLPRNRRRRVCTGVRPNGFCLNCLKVCRRLGGCLNLTAHWNSTMAIGPRKPTWWHRG